jgi:hypothetical protein
MSSILELSSIFPLFKGHIGIGGKKVVWTAGVCSGFYIFLSFHHQMIWDYVSNFCRFHLSSVPRIITCTTQKYVRAVDIVIRRIKVLSKVGWNGENYQLICKNPGATRQYLESIPVWTKPDVRRPLWTSTGRSRPSSRPFQKMSNAYEEAEQPLDFEAKMVDLRSKSEPTGVTAARAQVKKI